MPNTATARVLGNQLLRCGTSVAANYHASCRAKSKADFISKMGTVEEETDEAEFWIEMLVDANLTQVASHQNYETFHRRDAEFSQSFAEEYKKSLRNSARISAPLR